MIGVVGTIPRMNSRPALGSRCFLWVVRWLLAFSFDVGFAIENVYRHHRYVSTINDPATAPRGRNVYAHIILSTVRGIISPWHIEAALLRRRGLAVLSIHNAYLHGLGGLVKALLRIEPPRGPSPQLPAVLSTAAKSVALPRVMAWAASATNICQIRLQSP